MLRRNRSILAGWTTLDDVINKFALVKTFYTLYAGGDLMRNKFNVV